MPDHTKLGLTTGQQSGPAVSRQGDEGSDQSQPLMMTIVLHLSDHRLSFWSTRLHHSAVAALFLCHWDF